jgi:hypothetical protein
MFYGACIPTVTRKLVNCVRFRAPLHYNDYNAVFAVPGRVTDKYSQGCNNLIKTQASVHQRR